MYIKKIVFYNFTTTKGYEIPNKKFESLNSTRPNTFTAPINI